MEINKELLKNFREDFGKVAKLLENKYGLVIKLNNNMTYTSKSITAGFKAFVAETGENGNSIPFEQLEFNKLCGKYGFTPEDYMCNVSAGGNIYKLYGFNPKARKNKYIILGSDGIRYMTSKVEKI